MTSSPVDVSHTPDPQPTSRQPRLRTRVLRTIGIAVAGFLGYGIVITVLAWINPNLALYFTLALFLVALEWANWGALKLTGRVLSSPRNLFTLPAADALSLLIGTFGLGYGLKEQHGQLGFGFGFLITLAVGLFVALMQIEATAGARPTR